MRGRKSSHFFLFLRDRVSCILGWFQPSYVIKDDLECLILLTLLPKCGMYHQAWFCALMRIKPRTLCMLGNSPSDSCILAINILEQIKVYLLCAINTKRCVLGLEISSAQL